MDSKYFIRKIEFVHDDSNLSEAKGFGGLSGEFTNLEQAETTYWKLEQEKFQGATLANYYGLFQGLKPVEVKDVLTDFLKRNYNPRLFEQQKIWNGQWIDSSLHLPETLSLEATKEIQEKSGLRFYRLFEMKVDECFWGIKFRKSQQEDLNWIKQPVYRPGEGVDSTPLIFNEEQQAEDFFCERGNYWLSNVTWEGSLDLLSETPLLLEQFLEKEPHFSFQSTDKCLKINFVMSEHIQSLIILNAFLREKFLSIEKISIEELRKVGLNWEVAEKI